MTADEGDILTALTVMVGPPLGSADEATVPVLAADQTPLGWGRWVREGPRHGADDVDHLNR